MDVCNGVRSVTPLLRYSADKNSLLRNDLFTDFTIKAGGHNFKVHKAYLYPHCGYFRALLTGTNKVFHLLAYRCIKANNIIQEIIEGEVEFKDIEPCLMARLILFCYRPDQFPKVITDAYFQNREAGKLVDKFVSATTNCFELAELASEMYALGDRLDAPQLQHHARECFLRAWRKEDDGDEAPPCELVDADGCSAVIRHVYNSTLIDDRALRDIIILDMLANVPVGNEDLLDTKEYVYLYDLIEQVPNLAIDIARLQLSEASFSCINCESASQRHILSRCGCQDPAYLCDNKQCTQARKARSFCITCFKFGTIKGSGT